MVRQKYTVAAFFEVAYYRLKIRDCYRVYAAERFVKKYKKRLDSKAARDLDTSALASGKRLRLCVFKLGEPVLFEQI